MTVPGHLTSALEPGEDILWHSPALASDRLSDYGGGHELIARLLFALSSVMALVFFLGMREAGRVGLSLPLLLYVCGPIAIGLILRYAGRYRARAKAQSTHYAITTRRLIIANATSPESHGVTADTHDSHILQMMRLPKEDASKAQASIAQLKASL